MSFEVVRDKNHLVKKLFFCSVITFGIDDVSEIHSNTCLFA